MILVVADTSPLNYLVQIDCQEVLAALYQRVLIPAAVFRELTHPDTPAAVRAWIKSKPEWLEVREVSLLLDPALSGLDPGEREAIQLAHEVGADLLLIDERLGVKFAQRQDLNVTGTLGVLLQAARMGLVDLNTVLRRLQATAFRHTPRLLEEIKRMARESAG